MRERGAMYNRLEERKKGRGRGNQEKGMSQAGAASRAISSCSRAARMIQHENESPSVALYMK